MRILLNDPEALPTFSTTSRPLVASRPWRTTALARNDTGTRYAQPPEQRRTRRDDSVHIIPPVLTRIHCTNDNYIESQTVDDSCLIDRSMRASLSRFDNIYSRIHRFPFRMYSTEKTRGRVSCTHMCYNLVLKGTCIIVNYEQSTHVKLEHDNED